MNHLLKTVRSSVCELQMGVKGLLSMTESMDALLACVLTNDVPESWHRQAYPSVKALGAWLADLQLRVAHLEMWMTEIETGFGILSSTWISGLFNPVCFLTAVKQNTARRNKWDLNKAVLHTEVTRKHAEEIDTPSRDGAYVHGLFLEGAGWDWITATLTDSVLKELHPPMPVLFLKVKLDTKKPASDGLFVSPVYVTPARGPTYIFSATLRTKMPPSKWVLGGVALMMSLE